ncbi:MAG: OmpA family protein [Bacteroidetes bacterium]|nr:OmpA family protein [Bacteroidota bacterium]
MKRFLIPLLFCPLLSVAQQQNITVYFDFDRSELTAATISTLDSLIALAQPINSPVQLYGHCDGKGSDAYNDALSTRRVNAVRNYLMQHQINGALIAAEGYGKRKPLNNNGTEEERALNRRVEISFELPVKTVKETTPVAPAVVPEPVPAAPVITNKELKEIITDTAIKAGSSIVLKNINFVGGMHQFLSESFPALKELLDVMLANKTLVIQIQGHICCLPGNVDGYDFQTQTTDLSALRAKAVIDYLIGHGVEKERLSFVGLGHSQPLYAYPEKNEEERKLNRRVEIKIISK